MKKIYYFLFLIPLLVKCGGEEAFTDNSKKEETERIKRQLLNEGVSQPITSTFKVDEIPNEDDCQYHEAFKWKTKGEKIGYFKDGKWEEANGIFILPELNHSDRYLSYRMYDKGRRLWKKVFKDSVLMKFTAYSEIQKMPTGTYESDELSAYDFQNSYFVRADLAEVTENYGDHYIFNEGTLLKVSKKDYADYKSKYTSRGLYNIVETSFDSNPAFVTLNYTSDPINGVIYDNWDNGKLKFEITYSNGVLDGQFSEWYENGELKNDWYFENGELTCSSCFDSYGYEIFCPNHRMRKCE